VPVPCPAVSTAGRGPLWGGRVRHHSTPKIPSPIDASGMWGESPKLKTPTCEG